MASFKVDEHMCSHPVVGRAGDAALGLWLRMGCWLANYPKQGDRIPKVVAKHYGTKTQIRRLIESELWAEADDDYIMRKHMNIAGSGLVGAFWSVEDSRPRKSISPTIRAAVYARDEHSCVSCGATEWLTLDHIYPHSLGGEDTFDNLQTLCQPCNSRKGSRV